jgi:hypothetical protein
MKRIILMILMISILSLPVYADAKETLSNIVEKTEEVVETTQEVIEKIIDIVDIVGHWGEKYISKLMDLSVISGYGDGTFKPDKTITVAEFTKLHMAALGYDVGAATEGHWASGYIEEALKYGTIKQGEFRVEDYDREISRGEMARMIARSEDGYPGNWKEYKANITDYNKIPSKFQDSVVKAYTVGVISGYPDSSFKYDRSATRAEASTMIIRLIDESERQVPTLKVVETVETNYQVKTEVTRENGWSVAADYGFKYYDQNDPRTEHYGSGSFVNWNEAIRQHAIENYYKDIFPTSYNQIMDKVGEVYQMAPSEPGKSDYSGYFDGRLVKLKRWERSVSIVVGIKGVTY